MFRVATGNTIGPLYLEPGVPFTFLSSSALRLLSEACFVEYMLRSYQEFESERMNYSG